MTVTLPNGVSVSGTKEELESLGYLPPPPPARWRPTRTQDAGPAGAEEFLGSLEASQA